MGAKTTDMGVRMMSRSVGIILPNARKIRSFMLAKLRHCGRAAKAFVWVFEENSVGFLAE